MIAGIRDPNLTPQENEVISKKISKDARLLGIFQTPQLAQFIKDHELEGKNAYYVVDAMEKEIEKRGLKNGKYS